MASAPGIVIAAPGSGHGKTMATLGLIAALRQRGLAVGSFKVGPDYIDPAFHQRASGSDCVNLDDWAMRETTIAGVADQLCHRADILVGEGMMGLFDGAPDGRGSTADVAARLGLPVILVIDVHAQAASAAAIVHGFATFRSDIEVAGVVFNRVGSEGHARALAAGCRDLPQVLLGFLPHDDAMLIPERHLGLMQADEHGSLETFIERAGELCEAHIDIKRLISLAKPVRIAVGKPDNASTLSIPVLGQHIAVARDEAFAFVYPHILAGWRASGAEISFFSPLGDEAPSDDADAIYLPGGYPELHAGRLAANASFLEGLRSGASRRVTIFGECGGYMVLGQVLIDGDGIGHAMAGLLPVQTSFAEPRLHLGYRIAALATACALGAKGRFFRGHEFHYASVAGEAGLDPLFECADALGEPIGNAGCRVDTTFGSYIHLIDRA